MAVKLVIKAGHDVVIANSRGPESLSGLTEKKRGPRRSPR
jgi:predicted Fe-Mo cluster-binding NifX family protein